MSHMTYNTRLIFQNDEDKQKLIKTLESHRFAWNEASKIHFGAPKNSIVDLHAKFYQKFRKEQPQIPSQVVIRAEQECLSAYRTTKSNRVKLDKPVEKRRLAMRLDKRIYTYKPMDESFKLTTLEKRISCKFHKYSKLEEFLSTSKFLDPLLFVRNGDVWISLTFDVNEIPCKQKLAVGIDVGCRINAATSEGNLYVDKKFNSEKRSLRYLKRGLQSKGTKSAKRHLKKLRHKEQNKNRNFTHYLSNKLIKDTQADVLVLEDLTGIKKKKNKFVKGNRVSQTPFYQLKAFLTYKAPLYGKTVIEVDPSYTSQIDSETGKLEGERRGRRFYSDSGKIYDADVNAAVNIAKRSKLPVSLGSRKAIGTYGQAVVNQPIVSVAIRGNIDKPLNL